MTARDGMCILVGFFLPKQQFCAHLSSAPCQTGGPAPLRSSWVSHDQLLLPGACPHSNPLSEPRHPGLQLRRPHP